MTRVCLRRAFYSYFFFGLGAQLRARFLWTYTTLVSRMLRAAFTMLRFPFHLLKLPKGKLH